MQPLVNRRDLFIKHKNLTAKKCLIVRLNILQKCYIVTFYKQMLTHTHMHTHICVCVCVCIYIYIYMCVYIYIQVHLNKLEWRGQVNLFQQFNSNCETHVLNKFNAHRLEVV